MKQFVSRLISKIIEPLSKLSISCIFRLKRFSSLFLSLLADLSTQKADGAPGNGWKIHPRSPEFSGNPTARSLNAYYRTADLLYGCKNALEKHLAQRERDLFSLSESIVLYDLTNTYFEGQCAKNSSAAYGRSKEKRTDCKLATMGLVVDGDGFPKYSRFYPGNQSETVISQNILTNLPMNISHSVN